MGKKEEIILILLMVFTLIYATVGNPDNELWSGSYFIVNYITLFVLFRLHKSRIIRLVGISLSISIIIFIILKFFLHLHIERYYTFIPFLICLIGLIIYEHNESRKRKNP